MNYQIKKTAGITQELLKTATDSCRSQFQVL
jgi:hypothetical protein